MGRGCQDRSEMARHFPYHLTTAVRLQNKNRMPGETIQKAVILSNSSTQHTRRSGPCTLCVTTAPALSHLSQRGSSVVSSSGERQHLKESLHLESTFYRFSHLDNTPESQVELIHLVGQKTQVRLQCLAQG